MPNDPVKLAAKIGVYIAKNAPVSYSELATRANGHEVDPGIFLNAMAIIHRSKVIEAKNSKDDIVYVVKKKVEKGPGSHLTWVRNNYPAMTKENSADHPAFADLDFSHLFMTPEEAEKFKAELKGRVYIPSKRYQKKKTTI